MIPNWPWAWPCWNSTTSYKFSVSVKKIGEGWTGGASDIVKAESSGEDPRATGGLVSNLPHPRVNKTKQHTPQHSSRWAGTPQNLGVLCWLPGLPGFPNLVHCLLTFKWGGITRWGYRHVLVVREIHCGNWLARGYMPAHQHCDLFYPLAGDLIRSARLGSLRSSGPGQVVGS